MRIEYWMSTLLSQAAIIPLIAWWARSRAGLSMAWVWRLSLLLAGWLLLAVGLAQSGVFLPAPGRPPMIGLAVFTPIVLGLLMLRGVRAPEAALALLMGLQVMRIEGFEFVIAGWQGVLPGQFAYPAGWGDALIGVTAPLVAIMALRRASGWRTVALLWNCAGILDLVDAVFLGVTSSPGPLQLFAGEPTTALMTQLPLSLIPTFGVPLAVLGHIVALQGLRASRPYPNRAVAA